MSVRRHIGPWGPADRSITLFKLALTFGEPPAPPPSCAQGDAAHQWTWALPAGEFEHSEVCSVCGLVRFDRESK